MLSFQNSLTHWISSALVALTVLSVESLHAQSFAYVAKAGSNTVAVVNPADNSIAAQISVPSGPTPLAVKPDGNTIYVASSNLSNVSVIDAASRSITATISLPVGAQPTIMAVSPNGSLL